MEDILEDVATVYELASHFRVTHRTIWRWVSNGTFPKPLKLPGTNAARWKVVDVNAWINAQQAERDAEQQQETEPQLKEQV